MSLRDCAAAGHASDAEIALLAFALVDEVKALLIGPRIRLSPAAGELLGIMLDCHAATRAVGPVVMCDVFRASPECRSLAERVAAVTVAELVESVGTFAIVASILEGRSAQPLRRAA